MQRWVYTKYSVDKLRSCGVLSMRITGIDQWGISNILERLPR